jgi:hypothetical protein
MRWHTKPGDLDRLPEATVEPIMPDESGELLRNISRIAYDPSLAPDDALRRIRTCSASTTSPRGTSMTSDQTPPAGWFPDESANAPAGQQRRGLAGA